MSLSHRGGIDAADVILLGGRTRRKAQELVHPVLVVGADGAGAAADGFTGQVQVFTDVPGVDQDIFGSL